MYDRRWINSQNSAAWFAFPDPDERWPNGTQARKGNFKWGDTMTQPNVCSSMRSLIPIHGCKRARNPLW